MLSSNENYRSYLKNILAKKITQHPSYSLRAFSRDLKLAPGFLSDVLNGKKNISIKAALQIAESLKLSTKEAEYFRILVEIESAKKNEARIKMIKKLENLFPKRRPQSLSLDSFRTISEWHHLAIIEVLELNGFEKTAVSIAKILKISKIDADTALDRLERLGLIQKTKDGQYIKKSENYLVSSEKANEALRAFHRQTLSKAIDAIGEQDNTEKFIGSETMAFDPADLEKVKEAAEVFFSTVLEISARSNNKKNVYHLGIQFFKLSQDRGNL
jgi:uncharacterized protein (TIGR02147 family)